MVKKGKPMQIELQRDVIRKIILKRGNTGVRKTIEGKSDLDNISRDGDTSELDEGAILDNVGPELTLQENIDLLEREGFLLPVPAEEMDDHRTKQAMEEQEEFEEEEKQKKMDQVKDFYGIKYKRPKRVIVDGKTYVVED